MRLANQRFRLAQVPLRAGHILGQQGLSRADLHTDGEGLLLHRIVQLAGQVVSFFYAG